LGNTPPTAVNDDAATLPGVAVEIDVPGNDSDTNSEIDRSTVTIINSPSHGVVEVDQQTGIVTYTPDQNYSGNDTFNYSICDDGIPCGSMCDTATVIINIGDYNNPPVALNDTFTVMCYPLIANLMKNDYDPDGDSIFMETIPVEYPQNGTVILGIDGSLHYMPNEGFTGIDSFVYRICDNGIPSLCDTAKVIITVLPDTDCDGVPDYDDIDTECALFIPEGFSPNGDGVHDFFQVYCIEKYPDAIMYIFDRAGNKLFEKAHYGNLDHWGSDQDAWWWGNAKNRWIIGRGTLPAGNYLYVLELGTGEVRTGTVMISY
jgi:gliding motility-associated-like protein